MFEKKEDLIDYTMERTGLCYDSAEDYVDHFIQEVYDCEGDMVAICNIIFQFFLCEPKDMCVAVLED